MKPTRLLAAAALLLSACRNFEDTPLKRAAAAGDVAQVQALLAAGTPADEPAHPRATALMIAARRGQVEVMRALIAAGADVDRRDRAVNGWTPLVHALHKGQNAAARLLLDCGAHPDVKLGGGATALMFAAAYGNAEMVRELLARGADPRAQAHGGVTALSNALGAGGIFDFSDGPAVGTCHLETVQALVAAAPDLQVPQTFTNRLASRFARSEKCRQAYALVKGARRS
ncbi:MAG TPA: ankyrin repeat domain-containing protein [Vicinamibacteria bacterium]